MNICLITDDNYSAFTEVLIRNLINTNPESVIYVLADNLNPVNQMWLIKAGAKNVYDVADKVNEFTKSNYFINISRAALIKFLIPEILGELDKVLYLDTDIYVRGSLSSIYHMELTNDKYLAMSIDPQTETESEYMKEYFKYFDMELPYFNSGVILMNLVAMRGMDLTNRYVDEYKSKSKFLMFYDQCTINIVSKGCITPINTDYVKFTDSDINKDTVIVHYIEFNKKPWFGVKNLWIDYMMTLDENVRDRVYEASTKLMNKVPNGKIRYSRYDDKLKNWKDWFYSVYHYRDGSKVTTIFGIRRVKYE